ncbi:MAG: NAD-dependent DNA ligase LigA [Planctomycetota bacterium]
MPAQDAKTAGTAQAGLLDAETDVSQLAELLRYHNQKYWVEHKPEISDLEYDRLVERLRELDPSNPVLTELVEDSGDFKKVRHAVPMLSIEKKFTVEDVAKWAAGAGAFGPAAEDGLTASFKVDGSSCSLVYENGVLALAASRGNGATGDDITRNARTIRDIPQAVPEFQGARVEVRGEIYLSTTAFKEAVARFEKELAAGKAKEEDRPVNPRNYCAGSIKQKDANITRERQLSFMAHGCVGKLPGADRQSDAGNLQRLAALGFKTAFFKLVRSAEEVSPAIAAIEAQRKSLPYEIDGVVFTINNLALHPELGSTSHHPRYRLAFKFARDRGETTVREIKWETSRNGRVCPTMVVDPIYLGGATVTNCTVHNAKTVKATGLQPGDRVLLEREVIPYFVQKVHPPAAPADASLPRHCPSCGAELGWDETETHLLCANLGGCKARLLDYLEHYCSRGVTNMLGIGPEVIKKLVDAGLLSTPAGLYTLTAQQIVEKIEREGETSARNKVAAIQARREQPLEVFLVSLGIRGLGPSVAARLASAFGTLDALLAATPEKLQEVEGIAETLAAGIHNGLRERQGLIAALLKHVSLKEAERTGGPLSGKSFCLTGHVEFDYQGKHYDARPDIEELIKSRGGTIKSVSKGLSYLVAGEGGGSKAEKAKKAGVPIVTAGELVRMLG